MWNACSAPTQYNKSRKKRQIKRAFNDRKRIDLCLLKTMTPQCLWMCVCAASQGSPPLNLAELSASTSSFSYSFGHPADAWGLWSHGSTSTMNGDLALWQTILHQNLCSLHPSACRSVTAAILLYLKAAPSSSFSWPAVMPIKHST